MRIAIIGAGPAGNCTAYHLASLGHEVLVFEKNNIIGPPVQCTGILSDHFTTIMQPSSSYVQNVVERTRVHAPNGNVVDTRIRKNYVVCRKIFDTFLADEARKLGASFHLGHAFQGYEEDGEKIKVHLKHQQKDVFVSVDRLVGADGPLSRVAKAAGLYENRTAIIGSQIEVSMDHKGIVEFYPFIGCYAWIVPVQENSVRIGVAAYKGAMPQFKQLVKQHIGIDYKEKTLENQSGVIPIFNPMQMMQKNKVYLVGDAAGLVKATTGGGINQSLKTAKILADCIHEHKDYGKAVRQKLFKNLYAHLVIHRMMQHFSHKDWNYLIDVFSKDPLKPVLKNKSRDKIIPMLFIIALRKPGMFRFSRYLSRKDIAQLRFLL